MTDKELIELAAKAAGLTIERWVHEAHVIVRDGNEKYGWSPLLFDADAFTLAVRCDIAFMLETERANATTNTGQRFTERLGTDPCAATRRAIVRAAAEIGKAMP